MKKRSDQKNKKKKKKKKERKGDGNAAPRRAHSDLPEMASHSQAEHHCALPGRTVRRAVRGYCPREWSSGAWPSREPWRGRCPGRRRVTGNTAGGLEARVSLGSAEKKVTLNFPLGWERCCAPFSAVLPTCFALCAAAGFHSFCQPAHPSIYQVPVPSHPVLSFYFVPTPSIQSNNSTS